MKHVHVTGQEINSLPTGCLFCCLLIFFQNHPFRKIISGIPSVSNSLDPDQARHFFGPDLGPNCLQRLSADDKSRQSQASNGPAHEIVVCWLYQFVVVLTFQRKSRYDILIFELKYLEIHISTIFDDHYSQFMY